MRDHSELWQCSICRAPGSEDFKVEYQKHHAFEHQFFGLVCDRCGRVLCGKCASKIDGRLCQCGELLVITRFDPRKNTLKSGSWRAERIGRLTSPVI